MIQKSDSAYLYGTWIWLLSNIAALIFTVKNIYVVANQQALHFEQLFKRAPRWLSRQRYGTRKFGLILGANGKNVYQRRRRPYKDDRRGISKARKIIKEKIKTLRPEVGSDSQTNRSWCYQYNDLSQNRLTDIVFDWNKMLNFESGSAPYLQYTYVRIQSIFKKPRVQKIKNRL